MSGTFQGSGLDSFSHFRQHEIILLVALLALRIHFETCPPLTHWAYLPREAVIGCVNFTIPRNVMVFWMECVDLGVHESKLLILILLEQFDQSVL